MDLLLDFGTFLLFFVMGLGTRLMFAAKGSPVGLENTVFKQWLPGMKGCSGVGLGNPVRSIRGLDKAQRMRTRSFIDHSGRKTQLKIKEINKMLWCLLRCKNICKNIQLDFLRVREELCVLIQVGFFPKFFPLVISNYFWP